MRYEHSSKATFKCTWSARRGGNNDIKQFSHKPNSNIIDPQPELKINFYDKIIDFRVLKLKRFRD